MTAKPVIKHHRVDLHHDRFLVLATDGLWDRLSDAEVVDIVSKYAGKPQEKSSVWSNEDKNAATALIRNALGGKNEAKVASLLALDAPLSRRYRDDITVVIVWFGGSDREWLVEYQTSKPKRDAQKVYKAAS